MVLLSDVEDYRGIDFGSGGFPGSRDDYSPESREGAEFAKGVAFGNEWAETWEERLRDEAIACVSRPVFMQGFGFGAAVELSTPGTFVSADDDLDFGLGPSEPISIDESTFNKGACLGAEWVQSLIITRPAFADEVKAVATTPHFLRGFAAGTIEIFQEVSQTFENRSDNVDESVESMAKKEHLGEIWADIAVTAYPDALRKLADDHEKGLIPFVAERYPCDPIIVSILHGRGLEVAAIEEFFSNHDLENERKQPGFAKAFCDAATHRYRK